MALTDKQQDEFDEMDAILNDYDRSLDDIFDTANGSKTQQKQNASSDKPPDELGIDQEIKLTKKRKLAPPLDETLLTSFNGVSKLQKIAKGNLKFRGRGHEFSDVAWLLGTYQVWLHELYPRAKFADGLAMIEKLGHKKRIQKLRSEWIEESKPKPIQDEYSDHESPPHISQPTNAENGSPVEQDSAAVEDDSLNTAAENSTIGDQAGAEATVHNRTNPDDQFPGVPDEDELDQLLAEEPPMDERPKHVTNPTTAGNVQSNQDLEDEDFGDEENIMRELGFP